MVNIFSASHLPQGKVWNVENFRLSVVQVKYWLFLTICLWQFIKTSASHLQISLWGKIVNLVQSLFKGYFLDHVEAKFKFNHMSTALKHFGTEFYYFRSVASSF